MKENKKIKKVTVTIKIFFLFFLPVRSGIVSKIEDCICSSANNYVNGTGIVEVELLEIPKVDVLKPSSFDKYIS